MYQTLQPINMRWATSASAVQFPKGVGSFFFTIKFKPTLGEHQVYQMDTVGFFHEGKLIEHKTATLHPVRMHNTSIPFTLYVFVVCCYEPG
jgi:hypothetical protein